MIYTFTVSLFSAYAAFDFDERKLRAGIALAIANSIRTGIALNLKYDYD